MEYIIKKVEIGYLKNANKTGIVQNSMTIYTIEKQVIANKICLIVGDNAVDIDNFDNVYPIVKRNKFKQISPYQKIDEQQIYALDVKELQKEDLSLFKKSKYEKRVKQYKKINR
ncbi:MAG: hypothetical protein E7157_05975 [Lactobacillales bacterium]|nr:hypothetical protein [Lactobacillales bacterium]